MKIRFMLSALFALFLCSVVPVQAAELTRSDILTTTSLNIAGTTLQNGSASDTCANDGSTLLRAQNDSGTNAYTITLATPRTVGGVAVADQTFTLPINGDIIMGPFPVYTFGSSLTITCAGTACATDVDYGCYRVLH